MIFKIFTFLRKDNYRFFKYCLVGLSGVFVNEGILFFLTEYAGLFYLVSSIFSIEVSIITNFILNELWTFKDMSNNHRGIPKRLVKFNVVSVAGLLINIVVLFLLTTLGLYYLISNLFGIGAATLWNYFVNLYWTWGRLKRK